MEGARTSSAAKEVRSALGWADPWGHMGAMASSSLHVERNSTERVVLHSVFCWVSGNKRRRNCTVQPVSWQHSALGILPFLVHEPGLPGRAALRHILADLRCSHDRLAETQGYVNKERFSRGSYSERKGEWLTMRLI